MSKEFRLRIPSGGDEGKKDVGKDDELFEQIQVMKEAQRYGQGALNKLKELGYWWDGDEWVKGDEDE